MPELVPISRCPNEKIVETLQRFISLVDLQGILLVGVFEDGATESFVIGKQTRALVGATFAAMRYASQEGEKNEHEGTSR